MSCDDLLEVKNVPRSLMEFMMHPEKCHYTPNDLFKLVIDVEQLSGVNHSVRSKLQ